MSINEFSKPIISVIVPIYKVEKWLPRCLESLISQTFTRFEVLLINDGSPDHCKEICLKYVKKDSRFKLFNKKNGGLSDARNYGIEKSNGKFLVFVDSDDYVNSEYLKELYDGIAKTNSQMAMCEYTMVNETGGKIKTVHFNEPGSFKNITGKKLLKYLFNKNGVANLVTWNKIYKRNIFVNLRFQKNKLHEDDFIIAKLVFNLKKIELIRRPLYYYVQRNNSIMSSKMTAKNIFDENEASLVRINYLKCRDHDLYKLARHNYGNWIIHIMRYANTVLYRKDIIYFQKQYNKFHFFYSKNKFFHNLKGKTALRNIYLAWLIFDLPILIINKLKLMCVNYIKRLT